MEEQGKFNEANDNDPHLVSPRQERLVPASVALPFPVELSGFTQSQKLETGIQ